MERSPRSAANGVLSILTQIDTLCASLPEELTYTIRAIKRKNVMDLPDAGVKAGLITAQVWEPRKGIFRKKLKTKIKTLTTDHSLIMD